MLVFIGLCLGIVTYLYFSRESFFAELIISFLPYIIVCCGLAVLVLIIYMLCIRRKSKNKSLKLFFASGLLIRSLGIGWMYYSEFFSFYNHVDENVRLVSDSGIKVFYANILYTNADFQSLQKRIEIEEPDIVILVEFSDAHEKVLKDFFQKNYPYMNRNSWSATLAGDVVFSKIPIENLSSHYVKSGEWNYSEITINCENYDECEGNLDLYVIHTAAPVSLEMFEMRNEQLDKLKFDFVKRNSIHPVMIIGDFNLSPWSYYYSEFINGLDIKNALSSQSPDYTRSLLGKKIFRSHIDQFFISDGISVSNVDISDLSGSDHRAFAFMMENVD